MKVKDIFLGRRPDRCERTEWGVSMVTFVDEDEDWAYLDDERTYRLEGQCIEFIRNEICDDRETIYRVPKP